MAATMSPRTSKDSEKLFSYELFGLTLASQLPLPELKPAKAGVSADVVIRLAPIPPIEGEVENRFVPTPLGGLLHVRDVGRYLVEDGRVVTVEPLETTSDRNLRLYLLGSVFGVVLHQRGLLPLHANSIRIGERAVAFLGHSGAGKSTMAAWFNDRGYQVLADDVCVVTFDADERPIAQPGIPRLRMWRDALEASGRSADAYELSFDDTEKYNVPTNAVGDVCPLPLGAVYLLKVVPPDSEAPLIEPLRGIEALDALMANTYRGVFVSRIGGSERHLASCLALLRSVQLFAVNRRWGKEHFERELIALQEHARALQPL